MTFKRFAPLLALLAAGCTATATGTVAPGASASPSTAPSMSASAAPSTNPSTAPSGQPSAAPSAAAAGGLASAEACEHMTEGPSDTKQASLVSMSRERALVKADHRRNDVQLVANAGKNEGYVLFENDKDGDIHFYLGTDVPFKLKQDGKDVPFETTAKSGFGCDTIKAGYAADLGIGQVELHFGPSDAQAVSVVLERVEGDHDHIAK